MLQEANYVRLQPQLVGVPKTLTSKLDKLEAVREKLCIECEEKGWPEDVEEKLDAADDKVRDARAEVDRYLTFTAAQKATSGCLVGFGQGGELCVRQGPSQQERRPPARIREGGKRNW